MSGADMKRQLVALVRKDLKLFRSDRRALIVSFAVPAVLALLFGLAFRGAGSGLHLRSRVVNLDDSPGGARLADVLAKDPVLAATPATRAEALALLAKGKIDVALVIPAHFAADAVTASHGSGTRPALEVLADPNSRTEGNIAQGVAERAVVTALGPDLDPEVTRCAARQDPFEAKIRAAGAGGDRYDGAAHALAGMGVQFILIGAIDSAVGLLNERQIGMFRRLRAAPLSRAVLIGSRLISGAIVAMLVITFLYLFGSTAMDVHIGGSKVGFLLVTASFALMASALGVLISTFGKTPQATRGAGMFIVLLATFLSGAWLPTFMFPEWLRSATLFVPTRWAVDGLDAMSWRGLGTDAALAPAGVMLLTALVLGGWAAKRFKWD
jgi:ABC-2 type transport system permease protein